MSAHGTLCCEAFRLDESRLWAVSVGRHEWADSGLSLQMLCPELGIAKAAIQALATETHMLHRAPRSAMRRKRALQS